MEILLKMITPYKILRTNKSLFIYWAGDFISSLGNVITSVAIPFYVLKLTGSPGIMGIALAIQWLPGLFVRLIAGVVVDRVDRKKLLVLFCLLQAVVVALLTIATSLTLLYALIFIMGMLQQVVFPALLVIIPQLVKKDELVTANALLNSSRYLSQVFGGTLGGAFIMFIGVKWAFLVDAASFIIFAFLLLLLPSLPATRTKKPRKLQNILKEFGEGVIFVGTNPSLRSICLLALLGMFTAQGVGISIVILCKEIWQVDSFGYGLLSTVSAVGAFFSSLIVGSLGIRTSKFRMIAGCFIGQAILLALLGVFPVYAFAFFVRFLLGAITPLWNVPLDAYLQEGVPTEKLGRMYSMTGVSIALGMVLAGFFGGQVTQRYGSITLLFVLAVILFGGFLGLSKSLVKIDGGKKEDIDEISIPASG